MIGGYGATHRMSRRKKIFLKFVVFRYQYKGIQVYIKIILLGFQYLYKVSKYPFTIIVGYVILKGNISYTIFKFNY